MIEASRAEGWGCAKKTHEFVIWDDLQVIDLFWLLARLSRKTFD